MVVCYVLLQSSSGYVTLVSVVSSFQNESSNVFTLCAQLLRCSVVTVRPASTDPMSDVCLGGVVHRDTSLVLTLL